MTKPDQSVQDDKITRMLNDETMARHEMGDDMRRDMRALQIRVSALERGVKENTELTETVSVDTKELLDLFRAAKGGFRVVGWLGTFAKWVAGIVAGGATVYVAWQKLRGQA